MEAAVGDAERIGRRIEYGIAHSAVSDHEAAIAQYTKVIEMDPTGIAGYVNRALERTLLGDHEGAIADYDAAIANFPKDLGNGDTSRFGRVYRDRGRTYLALGERERGFTDLDRALQLGDASYYNEGGDKGPRLSDIPEQLEQYRALT